MTKEHSKDVELSSINPPSPAPKQAPPAAKQNNKEGQYHLAHCFEAGIGVEKDKKQASHYYHFSAKQNYAPAKEKLQNLQPKAQETQTLQKKLAQVLGIRNSASKTPTLDLTNPVAVYEAGNEYLQLARRLSDPNSEYQSALFYYQLAAHQLNYAPAQVALGRLYLDEDKRFSCIKHPLDIRETARSLFKSAAKQGDKKGQYHFARCLKEGIGGEQDKVLATEYYKLSAAQSYELAQSELDARTPIELSDFKISQPQNSKSSLEPTPQISPVSVPTTESEAHSESSTTSPSSPPLASSSPCSTSDNSPLNTTTAQPIPPTYPTVLDAEPPEKKAINSFQATASAATENPRTADPIKSKVGDEEEADEEEADEEEWGELNENWYRDESTDKDNRHQALECLIEAIYRKGRFYEEEGLFDGALSVYRQYQSNCLHTNQEKFIKAAYRIGCVYKKMAEKTQAEGKLAPIPARKGEKQRNPLDDAFCHFKDAIVKPHYTKDLIEFKRIQAKAHNALGELCLLRRDEPQDLLTTDKPDVVEEKYKDATAVNLKQAVEYFKKAAKLGDPRGQYNYGCSILKKDFQEAAYWISRSAAQGFKKAIAQYAKWYKDGINAAKDPEMAARLDGLLNVRVTAVRARQFVKLRSYTPPSSSSSSCFFASTPQPKKLEEKRREPNLEQKPGTEARLP